MGLSGEKVSPRMRFLLTVQPMFGHFHAMVPLAQALKAQGHEVAFATGRAFGPAVQQAGFRHFPAGFDFDGSAEILAALPGWERIAKAAPPGPEGQLYGFVQGLAPQMVEDLLELGQTWRPEVVIRDPLEFGGYLAAEVWERPHATVLWAMYISAKAAGGCGLEVLRRSCGLPPDPTLDTLDRYLLIGALPPDWAFPNWPPPPVTHRYRTPPYDAGGEISLPEWIDQLPNQPTIYATLGTTFNRAGETFRAVVDAFRGEPLNLVMTVGRQNDPAQFQPPDRNIHVARYIPQSRLLARCQGVIFHGGFNTLLSALWHALPVVVIPQQAGDQVPTARRCIELGLGVMLEDQPPDPVKLRHAVRAIVERPDFRGQANQLRNKTLALPSLAEAVKRLELLAKTRLPQVYAAP